MPDLDFSAAHEKALNVACRKIVPMVLEDPALSGCIAAHVSAAWLASHMPADRDEARRLLSALTEAVLIELDDELKQSAH